MNLRGLFETMLIWISDSSRFISGPMSSQTMDSWKPTILFSPILIVRFINIHDLKRICIFPLKAKTIISSSKHNEKFCLVSGPKLILCYLFSLINIMAKFFLQSMFYRGMKSSENSFQFVTGHIAGFYSYGFVSCKCFNRESDCFPLYFN